jgi:hypothetical protein
VLRDGNNKYRFNKRNMTLSYNLSTELVTKLVDNAIRKLPSFKIVLIFRYKLFSTSNVLFTVTVRYRFSIRLICGECAACSAVSGTVSIHDEEAMLQTTLLFTHRFPPAWVVTISCYRFQVLASNLKGFLLRVIICWPKIGIRFSGHEASVGK